MRSPDEPGNPTNCFMDKKSMSKTRNSMRVLRGSGLAGLLILFLAAPLLADEPYLAAGHPDGVALLAPPPVPGSEEEAADLQEARAVFNSRTADEEARAKRDDNLTFDLFKPAIGPEFDLGKLVRTDALLKKVKAEIAPTINEPKDFWKRKRPYQLDEHLALGKPESSFGYPSGHSARGTVYALVLAELFPEKKDAILEEGREIGWDRVLMGKHFPTDIQAGRVLARAIVRELMANLAFQRDLAQAKAEIANVRRAN